MKLCLLRMLFRLRRDNKRWRIYARMLTEENRWRAMRYGVDEGMIDFAKAEIVSYKELLDELVALVNEDAIALQCFDEIQHAYKILARGTSSHRQLALYETCKSEGANKKEALIEVVDWLIVPKSR